MPCSLLCQGDNSPLQGEGRAPQVRREGPTRVAWMDLFNYQSLGKATLPVTLSHISRYSCYQADQSRVANIAGSQR